MRISTLLLLTVTTVPAFGCRGTVPDPFHDERAAPAQSVDVIVTNQNWATVRVYATASGRNFAMGTVETGNTQTLKVPAIATGAFDLRLSVYAIGSGEWFTTDPISVSEGSAIEFTVENNLVLSHYMVIER